MVHKMSKIIHLIQVIPEGLTEFFQKMVWRKFFCYSSETGSSSSSSSWYFPYASIFFGISTTNISYTQAQKSVEHTIFKKNLMRSFWRIIKNYNKWPRFLLN